MSSEENKKSIDPEEQDTIARTVRAWLNTCSYKPRKIGFEYLSELGMAMSTIQGIYTKRFIDGSYEAQYQFRLVYRLIPSTDDERLTADETLNKIGRWITVEADPPVISNNIIVRKFERTMSSLFNRYDDGAEDHIIDITMTYEVNV